MGDTQSHVHADPFHSCIHFVLFLLFLCLYVFFRNIALGKKRKEKGIWAPSRNISKPHLALVWPILGGRNVTERGMVFPSPGLCAANMTPKGSAEELARNMKSLHIFRFYLGILIGSRSAIIVLGTCKVYFLSML